MKNLYWLQNIFENKYSFLLTILLLIFFIYPFVYVYNEVSPLLNILFLVAVLPALMASLRKKNLRRVLFFYFGSFVIEILITLKIIPEKLNLSLISLSFSIIFIGLCIFILTRNINRLKIVNADIIKGGISIYILMGLFWAIVYVMVHRFNPGAFHVANSDRLDYLYYSFVTLLTIGYGDINAIDKFAKIFSVLEAVGGQIFLATFISRLVGIAIAQEMRHEPKKE